MEILKTLYRGADILILDEPTAVLAPQEIDELMETMRSMVDAGQVDHFHQPQTARSGSGRRPDYGLAQGRGHGRGDGYGRAGQTEIGAIDGGARSVFQVEKSEHEPGEVVLSVRDLHAETIKACRLCVASR